MITMFPWWLFVLVAALIYLRGIYLFYFQKVRILAEYDKEGRKLLEQRISSDYALLQQHGIRVGHTLNPFGIAIKIEERPATNNMVRDEVVVQRGQEPRSHDGWYTTAREPGTCCCYAIDFASSEGTYSQCSDSCSIETLFCAIGYYRSRFGEDRKETKYAKYVCIEYLDKHGMKGEYSVPHIVKILEKRNMQEKAKALARAYDAPDYEVSPVQQNGSATAESVKIQICANSSKK